MNKRNLTLHVGTHKTGTTSIQVFLGFNQAALATKGLYVPRTGRPVSKYGTPYCGHHNLAWELNATSAFDPRDGTFAQMLDEVYAAPGTHVVLSSEDFEWLHAKPAVLAEMAGAFDGIGCTATVAVYLRAQNEYVQAVYVEGSKAGWLMNYDRMIAEVHRNGTFVPDPLVVNRFEYEPLVDAFANAFGQDRVVVRAYPPRGGPDRLLREFLEITGVKDVPLDALLRPARLNETPTLATVLAGMYRAVAQRDPAAPDPQAIATRLFPGDDLQDFNLRFDVMTKDETLSLLERFRPGNLRVAERWGARVPFIGEADVAHRSAAAWALAQKQRRLLDEAIAAWKIEDTIVYGRAPSDV